MDTIIIIVAFIVVVAGIIFAVNRFNTKRKAEAANWPDAAGTVTHSAVDTLWGGSDSDATYEPDVRYTYEVGGITYTGKRIAYAGMGFGTPDKAQEVCDRYPVGAKVTVYHDPAKPDRCVLER